MIAIATAVAGCAVMVAMAVSGHLAARAPRSVVRVPVSRR